MKITSFLKIVVPTHISIIFIFFIADIFIDNIFALMGVLIGISIIGIIFFYTLKFSKIGKKIRNEFKLRVKNNKQNEKNNNIYKANYLENITF